jgi:hypothetical protein
MYIDGSGSWGPITNGSGSTTLVLLNDGITTLRLGFYLWVVIALCVYWDVLYNRFLLSIPALGYE